MNLIRNKNAKKISTLSILFFLTLQLASPLVGYAQIDYQSTPKIQEVKDNSGIEIEEELINKKEDVKLTEKDMKTKDTSVLKDVDVRETLGETVGKENKSNAPPVIKENFMSNLLMTAQTNFLLWTSSIAKAGGSSSKWKPVGASDDTQNLPNLNIKHTFKDGSIVNSDRYSNKRIGSKDGQQIFCAEPDVSITTNYGYVYNPGASTHSEKAGLAAYYGQKFANGNLRDLFYAEVVVQWYSSQYRKEDSRKLVKTEISDPTGKNRVSQAGLDAFKKRVDHAVEGSMKYPSFKTSETQSIEPGKTLTLTDKNESLQYYKVVSTPKEVTAKINGNKLEIRTETYEFRVGEIELALDIPEKYFNEKTAWWVYKDKHSGITDSQMLIEPSIINPMKFKLKIENELDVFSINLRKTDTNGKTYELNKSPDLTGAEFKVEFYNSKEITNKPNYTWIFRTDKNGEIHFSDEKYFVSGDSLIKDVNNKIALPFGTIKISETKTPKGYDLNKGFMVQNDVVTEGNSIIINHHKYGSYTTIQAKKEIDITDKLIKVLEPIKRGSLKIQKFINLADETNTLDTPGNTKIGPLTYKLTNLNNYTVDIDNEWIGKNQSIEIKTNDKGYFESPDNWLMYGKYRIEETSVGEGLEVGGSWIVDNQGGVNDFTTPESTNFQNTNKPYYGSIYIQKIDKDTGKPLPQGNANLKDAKFEIINKSKKYIVTADGKRVEVDKVATVITTDENGYAKTPERFLPYGEYEIKEVGTPEGYEMTLQGSGKVFISENGELYGYNGNIYIENNEDKVFEPVIRGGVEIKKYDKEIVVFDKNHRTQGDASFENAEFELINQSKNTVVVNKKEYKPNEVILSVKTDKNGIAKIKNDVLPYGTYLFKEVKEPEGYLQTGKLEQQFTILESGQIVNLTSADKGIQNEVIRGGFKIQKYDKDTNDTLPQGDGTFSDVYYTLVNKSKYSVLVDGEEYEPGEIIFTRQSDGNGRLETDSQLLPYGSYEVYESKAPTGYLKEGELKTKFKIREENKIVDLTPQELGVTNEVIRGGVKIQKRDLESGMNAPLGNAKLNAVFSIINRSKQNIIVKDKKYEPGESILEVTLDKNTGMFETENNLLPYGTYEIKEIETPEGYLETEDNSRIFKVREDGVIVDMSTQEGSIFNQVKRGDFRLRKINMETQKTIGNVKFRITSKTTGESHVIQTDDNGEYYSTSKWNKHTHDTNGGKADSGLWFGQYIDEEGNKQIAEVQDDLGALPYEWYEIKEIQTEANVGYKMWEDEFRIHRDEWEIDLGNIENEPIHPEMGTILTTIDGGKVAPLDKKLEVVDTITYKNLTVGVEYTAKGYLVSKLTEEKITDDFEVKFTPEKENGTVEIPMIVDTTQLESGDFLVAFEEFLVDGKVVLEHKDIDDKDQTIELIKIGTKATNADDDSQVIRPLEKVTVHDTVSYKNVEIGKEYVVEGILMDKETKKPFLDLNGQEVTSKTTFLPENRNGEVIVEFNFNASNLENGLELVVFENLYSDGKLYATHSDIEDESQTVTIKEPDNPDKPVEPEEPSKPKKPIIRLPKTGSESMVFTSIVGGLLAIIGIGINRKRKKK